MMQTPPDPASAAAAPDEPSLLMRPWVIAGCIAAALLFAVALAVLFVQWARNENPNAIIYIETAHPLDDAVVTITPMGGAMREPISAPFPHGPCQHILFHVPDGSYRVSVRGSHDEMIFPSRFESGEVRAIARAQTDLLLQYRPASRPVE